MAFSAGVAEIAAGAGVHRGKQLESGRKIDLFLDSGNGDFSGLHGFPQRLQNGPIEFRQFVEEKHAAMGKRDFSWLRMCAACKFQN